MTIEEEVRKKLMQRIVRGLDRSPPSSQCHAVLYKLKIELLRHGTLTKGQIQMLAKRLKESLQW